MNKIARLKFEKKWVSGWVILCNEKWVMTLIHNRDSSFADMVVNALNAYCRGEFCDCAANSEHTEDGVWTCNNCHLPTLPMSEEMRKVVTRV